MTITMKVNKKSVELEIDDMGIFLPYTVKTRGSTQQIIDYIKRHFSRKIYEFIFPNLCKIGRYYYRIDFDNSFIYEYECDGGNKYVFPVEVIRGEKL